MEKNIEIEGINPVELFGVNNINLSKIKSFFPKLKIVSRGNVITIAGDYEVMEVFEMKFQMILKYFHKFNQITENAIEQIMFDDGTTPKPMMALKR